MYMDMVDCAKQGTVSCRSDTALRFASAAESVFSAIFFIEDADLGPSGQSAKELSGPPLSSPVTGEARQSSGSPIAGGAPVELTVQAELDRIRRLRVDGSLFIRPNQTVFDYLLGRPGRDENASLRPEQWQAAVGRRLLTAEEEAARARYFDRKCATGIARAKNQAGAA